VKSSSFQVHVTLHHCFLVVIFLFVPAVPSYCLVTKSATDICPCFLWGRLPQGCSHLHITLQFVVSFLAGGGLGGAGGRAYWVW